MRFVRRQILVLLLASFCAPKLAYGRKAAAAPRRTGPSGAATMGSSTVQASARHNGHMNRHVARSNDYLRVRVDSGRARLTFNAASAGANRTKVKTSAPSGGSNPRGQAGSRRAREAISRLTKYNATPRRTSTFHDARVADAMYARALRDNRTAIAKWVRDPAAGPSLVVPFSSKSPVGTVYIGSSGKRGTGRFKAANSGVFVLNRTGVNGFYPMTAKLH